MKHPTPPLAVPRPANEPARLSALHRYGILDTSTEEDFDFLTEMAAHVCGAPYSFITFVDADRVWVKSAVGLRAGGERPRDDDFCSWSVLEHEGLEIRDLRADPRTADLPPTRERGYRMYSGVNLHAGDGLHVGTLCVLDERPRELSATQRRMLARLGRQVMALVELRAMQRELRHRVETLDRLARRDELTGLANRRALREALEREVAQAARYGGELSVVLIDIDHFKAVNDRHGHAAGDTVLRRIGALLAHSFRCVDIVGRYGGEEFLVVQPRTTVEGARASAEALRRALAEMDAGPAARPVTVSCGIAGTPHALDAEALVAAADAALYRAKREGRDRVVVAGD